MREIADQPETILYGYLTLPRRALRAGTSEGIAVFVETWMAGGIGRAQGPYDEMVFRAMVRDGARFYDPLGLESEGGEMDFQVGDELLPLRHPVHDLAGVPALSREAPPVGRALGREPGLLRRAVPQVFGTPLTRRGDWIDCERGFQRANLDAMRKYPTTPYRGHLAARPGLGSRAYVDSASHTLYAALNYPGTSVTSPPSRSTTARSESCGRSRDRDLHRHLAGVRPRRPDALLHDRQQRLAGPLRSTRGRKRPVC